MIPRLGLRPRTHEDMMTEWAIRVIERNRRSLSAVGLPMPPTEAEGGPHCYGCGHYGCVFETQQQHVVMKITRDADEAGFVVASMEAGNPYPGIVRYDGILELPGKAQRKTYVLWRDEAYDVGSTFATWGDTAQPFVWLSCLKIAANAARQFMRKVAPGDLRSLRDGLVARALHRHRYLSIQQIESEPAIESMLKSTRGIARAEIGLAAARLLAQSLASRKVSSRVGEAMVGWFDRGLLLCDVHYKNIGVLGDGSASDAVITDPGHALILNNNFDHISVPKLQVVERRRNPPYDKDEELAQLLYRREQQAFSEIYPDLAGVPLTIVDQPCNSPGETCRVRDVAWCEWLRGGRGAKTRMKVFLLRRALGFRRENLIAIFRHELGHLADPDADKPDSEKRADRIAETVTGEKIRYDRQDIQTTGPGRATRPPWLHR